MGIKNEHQYASTLIWRAQFKKNIREGEKLENRDLLDNVIIDALKSQVATFERELQEYETANGKMRLEVIVESTSTGFSCYVDNVHGLITVGGDLEELHKMFDEVLESHVEYLNENGADTSVGKFAVVWNYPDSVSHEVSVDVRNDEISKTDSNE